MLKTPPSSIFTMFVHRLFDITLLHVLAVGKATVSVRRWLWPEYYFLDAVCVCKQDIHYTAWYTAINADMKKFEPVLCNAIQDIDTPPRTTFKNAVKNSDKICPRFYIHWLEWFFTNAYGCQYTPIVEDRLLTWIHTFVHHYTKLYIDDISTSPARRPRRQIGTQFLGSGSGAGKEDSKISRSDSESAAAELQVL